MKKFMKIFEFFLKYQKLIIFGCLLISALSLIDKALGIGTIFVLFLASISLFSIGICVDERQRRILGALFLIVFSFHILIVLFIYYTNFQPLSSGGGDYNFYEHQAEEIVQRVQHGNFSLQGIGLGHYYPVIVAYIYIFTLESVLIGELFNAWLVALLVIFVYLIAREIGSTEKLSFLVGLIACFYPSLVFFGSFLLKEALVVLLCMVGLLLAIKIIKSFSVLKFLGFFIILTALIHFRFYIGYALMFGFIISWFLISNINIKKRVIHGLIMIFILGFCPLILGNGYYGFINFKSFLNVETITIYREVAYAPSVKTPKIQPQATDSQTTDSQATDSQTTLSPSPENTSSSIVIKTGFENPITFVKNSLLSFACSFLGPFPWQLTLRKYVFIFPEMVAWYFFLFFIARGVIEAIKERNKTILALIIFSVIVIGAVSLFLTNFGIITRIRMPAFLALLCLLPLSFGFLKDIKIPLVNNIFNI